ncbi:RHS repeat domain-containing protein [Flavobacterium sp. JP2137]|uniref:RHS repeat domain-containing protein n=1 Tax=Flavobacterium sp. JP2137 TaxID=3414510 RepID=UPI003D3000D2
MPHERIRAAAGDSSNFMARANKTVPQNGVLEARTANLQQQMKEVYEGANLDSPTFQARESDWEDDCGHELYDIKKRLLQEKNYDCLNVIKDLESHGLTDCEVLKEYKKAPCYLETACEEEYHQWLDYLQENGKTGCTTILKTLIEEGKSYCDVLYYIEKTTTCFEIITETDCYLEFIELYENCTRANDYKCIKFLQGLMTSEELDYCDIVEIIKESEFNVIYPPVIPPVDTFPPVEDPVVDPGNPDNETPPVIPDEPIIPEPPFIQGKIWWYHSDHLGSSSYLTDVNGMPTHYYEYLPFGELMVEHNNSNYDNVYKFNAKELDEKTGYYYYGARYYDPRTSLFLSVDPLAEQTMMPYQYVSNNPINRIDPTGMLDHDYKLNKETGNITLIKETTDDFDRVYNDDKSKYQDFKKGFLENKETNKKGETLFKSIDVIDGANAFVFFSRNSDVEWGIDIVGNKNSRDVSSVVSTSHSSNSNSAQSNFVYSFLSADNNNVLYKTEHSHPGDYKMSSNWPAYPSGFDNRGNILKGASGDRAFFNWMKTYFPTSTPNEASIYVPSINRTIQYDNKHFSTKK